MPEIKQVSMYDHLISPVADTARIHGYWLYRVNVEDSPLVNSVAAKRKHNF